MTRKNWQIILNLGIKHPLGIAGNLSIFGNEVTQMVILQVKYWADKLSGTNFGTNSNATNNLTNVISTMLQSQWT